MHQQILLGDEFEFSSFYGFRVVTFHWKAATFWFSCTNFSFSVNFLFKGFDQGLEVKQPKSRQMLPRFRIVESKTTIFIRTSLRQDVLWYTNVRPSVSHVTL
jgi:hypothetical protein